jgi:ATP-binding cassette, subfamily B, bacterial
MLKTYSLLYYISFTFKKSKFGASVNVILNIAAALIPIAQIPVLANFIDNTTQALSRREITESLIHAASFFIGILLLGYVVNIFSAFAKAKTSAIVGAAYERQLLKKQSCLSYDVIENSEAHELINRVTEDCSEKIFKGFGNLMAICEYAIRIAGIAITVMSANLYVGAICFLIMLIIIPIAKKCGEEDYSAYEASSTQFRRAKYFRSILSERDYADERKIFNYSRPVNEIWKEIFGEGIKISRAATKKNFVRIKAASCGTAIFSCLIAGLLLLPLKSGEMTAGLYISLVSASISLISLISWNIAYLIEDCISYKLYMDDFGKFMKLKEDNRQNFDSAYFFEKNKNVKEITFRNVRFKYPCSDKYTLENISFRMTSGRRYAFIGENGAGKTTIVKLLFGLYDNYEGDIFINNTNIRSMSLEELYSYFSVVHQDFTRYQIPLKDNLTIGCGSFSEQSLLSLIEKMGLTERFNSLPERLDTDVGRLGDYGVDFSGGEWQRIAIIRALMRNAPIQVMDEPTASLDPISERDLYDLFANSFQGDIGILITHRLGGAKNADEIMVISGGYICEQGTHDELITRKGKYHEMYEAQRFWYL